MPFSQEGWGRRGRSIAFGRNLSPLSVQAPRALSAAAHTAGAETRQVIEAVREHVACGESLARALSGHPAISSSLYVGVVCAGERSGDLAWRTRSGPCGKKWLLQQILRSSAAWQPEHLATLLARCLPVSA